MVIDRQKITMNVQLEFIRRILDGDDAPEFKLAMIEAILKNKE